MTEFRGNQPMELLKILCWNNQEEIAVKHKMAESDHS